MNAKRLPKVHRQFGGTFSTFCSRNVRVVECTADDRKTTCRQCLQAMGRYAMRKVVVAP